ncbi:MAG: ArdC family protein, partial [Spirochaetota bacterium]
MATKTKTNKKKSAKQIVLDRIIKKIEEGTTPWLEPNIAYPKSNCFNHLKLKKEPDTYKGYFYKGMINHLLLGDVDEDFFMTFNQIKQLGASVKKGSKSEMVVFFMTLTPVYIKEEIRGVIEKYGYRKFSFTKQEAGYIKKLKMNFTLKHLKNITQDLVSINANPDDVNRVKEIATLVYTGVASIPMLRYFNVFKLSDIEGFDKDKIEKMKETFPKYENKSIDDIDEFISNTGVEIRQGGNKRFYKPNEDYIQIPERSKFEEVNRYYSTLFHELCHSTGHKYRLNRELNTNMGSESYSKEELIAEIGSCMLLSYFGLDIPEHNYSYINGWLEVIKGDNNLLYESM